ncbi:MAG: isoprenyl transferase [Candidatus Delongbacteria bacterium]|nr:isoprenyl transferase [Candidatus Delongbacteria bacterium]
MDLTSHSQPDSPPNPRHVAIIMDGNGRWAKKRKMPRIVGHRAGIKTVKRIVEFAGKINLEYLTLYTFSTENWSRPQDEVSGLMKLFYENLISQINELNRNNVRLAVIGDLSRLPSNIQEELARSTRSLSVNTGLTLVLAINYGARDELCRAIRRIIQDVADHRLSSQEIDYSKIAQYLDTAAIPDPELIIRTSGEFRLSNFLLYQSAYSEFYISQKLWPDFNEEDFMLALDSFRSRDRRFGGIGC